jgi:hypothetical protein
MKPYLGMYVHMHWAYGHPYAARTWTLENWRGYATGLKALGYNLVMIWPVLETIPDPPTESDIAHLRKIQQVIDMLHDEFGMAVLITLGPNTMGNEKARQYTFEERPFFECDNRLNPGDAQVMDAFIAYRRKLFQYLGKADAVSIIDSDPGGYIGSTNAEFVNLLWRHSEMLREFNPQVCVYYWMWCGWEAYNQMWAEIQAGNPVDIKVRQEDFDEVIAGMQAWPADANWAVTAAWPQHFEAVKKFGIQDRAVFFPYGIIEGEPTFPLTNWDPAGMADYFKLYDHQLLQLGAWGNSQTHIVQLPHAYLFAHLAKGGTVEDIDLEGFGNGLIEGQGKMLVDAWTSLDSKVPYRMRGLAYQLLQVKDAKLQPGKFGGFLLNGPNIYVEDLAQQLFMRSDLAQLSDVLNAGWDWHGPLRTFIDSWGIWQKRTGFTNAFGDAKGIFPILQKIGDPQINEIIDKFLDFHDTSQLHTAVPRLLEAMRQAAG